MSKHREFAYEDVNIYCEGEHHFKMIQALLAKCHQSSYSWGQNFTNTWCFFFFLKKSPEHDVDVFRCPNTEHSCWMFLAFLKVGWLQWFKGLLKCWLFKPLDVCRHTHTHTPKSFEDCGLCGGSVHLNMLWRWVWLKYRLSPDFKVIEAPFSRLQCSIPYR